MKSFTQLVSMFTTLSQNSSSANQTLAGILINDKHRYLLLKYFNNERTFYLSTVGPQTLTTTSTLSSGASTATLTSSWTYPTCMQQVVFSDGEQRNVKFTQNSTALSWQPSLGSSATATLSAQGVQGYPLPADVSKISNDTITVGQLVYTPLPVQTIQEWTKLNALPYSASYPAYFFIYNKVLNFWPIPATTGNVITIYGQNNIADMTYSDYTTGTLASGGMVTGSNQVIGSSTSWSGTFPTNTDLTFANICLTATPPKGDGLPYQIQYFSSDTSATLVKPVVNAPNISGANYLIGQYPLLDANFHDMIVYGALAVYFNSIVKDADRYNMYNGLYKEKEEQMQFYLANKQTNVDLSVTPIQMNPNLFWQGS